jgi:hypothetical protein
MMHPRTEMIDGLDDILGMSPRIGPSSHDDPWLE